VYFGRSFRLRETVPIDTREEVLKLRSHVWILNGFALQNAKEIQIRSLIGFNKSFQVLDVDKVERQDLNIFCDGLQIEQFLVGAT